jgi:Ca2+-binding RTX toxin-like protein
VTARADAAPTCHGVRATAVGAPSARVVGTRGRDVFVTNGARAFHGRGGDDLVCVTGDGPTVAIRTLDGDDSVYVLVEHTLVLFHGERGSDEFHGNRNGDWVSVDVDGDDRITTGRGADNVHLRPARHQGGIRVLLGPGDDTLVVHAGRVRGMLDGGRGRDWLDIEHSSTHGWTVDNSAGTAAQENDARRLRWRSLERFVLRELRVPLLTFLGSDADEEISQIRGPGEPITHDRFFMGGGDDLVVAGAGDDVLDGGPGVDSINGGGGIDTCFAEARLSCELP